MPFEDFLALGQGLAFSQALRDGADLAVAAAADRTLLHRRLLEFVGRPEVKEALWLASPDFYGSLSLWKREPESAKGEKLERALYRYVARMTSRPTPFGLFAGCSVGKIGSETSLEIEPRTEYWRRSRLDMEYLCNLAEKISSDSTRQRQLRFRTNTSLYLAGSRYHHAQSYLSNDFRCYRLIATEPTTYLTATLERAVSGATAGDLASALVGDDPEISMQDAEDYIRQLIESQMLIPELMPPITGPDPLEDMLAQLEQAGESTLRATLETVSRHLHQLDKYGLGNEVEEYQQIVQTVSQLPCEYKLDHLVQVDMMKKASRLILDERVIRDILRGVEILHSLDACVPADRFEEFKRDFHERYQDQEIPLVLVLDDEVGIGFERKDNPDTSPESLLEDIEFSGGNDDSMVSARKSEFILLRKVEELAQARESTLELDAKLLESLRARNPLPLPDAFAAMIQILGQSGEGDKVRFYLHSAGGPSGALLLGRFCPADEQLTACVKQHIQAEEESRPNADVIYAEILHLPEGRIGNVVCRPTLRAYEIPFLAASRAPLDQQIPITDLIISVRNGRVVLRSQRLGREVVPRLTSAHGYGHGRNLKLYKFLCLLQTQGISGALSWNWGILEEASFLPRVTLGNIVLAPARWRMDKKTIEECAREAGAKRLRRIAEWRSSKQMPRFVLLAEADNQLLIDFENVLSLEMLIEYIKSRESVQLTELLADPEKLAAHSPEGGFTHELVVPFVRRKQSVTAGQAYPGLTQAAVVGANSHDRNFLPGSEWLFVKIYTSPSQVDRLLVDHVRPLVAKLLTSGVADRWFFIRYGDPHWHLRLRFHGDPKTLPVEVLPALWEDMETLQQKGKLWRMQLDTYEREVERYGGLTGMRITEKLFQYDSEFILELLAICDQPGGKIRWHLAFTAVDCLLEGLGLEMGMRRQIVNNLGLGQEKNFGVKQAYKKQVSEKYRKERPTLETLLEHKADFRDFPSAVQTALSRFAGQMKMIRLELEHATQAGDLNKTVEDLAASYVHMQLNRIFRSAANAQEMVLYDFLARTYDSRIARAKH